MIANILCALVLAAVLLRWLPARGSRPVKLALLVLLVVAVMLPFPYGAAGWVLAMTSEFSVTTAVLAALGVWCRLYDVRWMPASELRGLCVTVLLVALVFYPSSLGAITFDAYALGYGDFRFSTALLLLGLFCWISRAYVACLILVLAQGAYGLRLLGSDNLWDYLLDPWLVFWCLGWWLRDLLRRPAGAADANA